MRLQSRFTTTLFASLLILVSCEQAMQPVSTRSGRRAAQQSNSGDAITTDPNAIAVTPRPGMSPLGGSTLADPAITYVASSTLNVMNGDGSNQSAVYSPARGETAGQPMWSPDGSSICFFTHTSTGNYIKKESISVNSRNKVVAGSPTTLYTAPTRTTTDHCVGIQYVAWSATSATNKIAFVLENPNQDTGYSSKICLMSASGGTPTVLVTGNQCSFWTSDFIMYHWPTWSPDDSKIAVVRQWTRYTQSSNGTYSGADTGHYTIMIFDASTGAALDSIEAPGDLSNARWFIDHLWLQWSRDGSNTLAFRGNDVNGNKYLYYVAPISGATPSTSSVGPLGSYQWSPDNAALGLAMGGKYYSLTAGSSTKTTVLNSFSGSIIDWRR